MKKLKIKNYGREIFYKQYEVSKVATLDGKHDFISWPKEMVIPTNKIGDIEQVIFEVTETTDITGSKIPLDIVYSVEEYDDICKLMVLKTKI
jgi:hypothetical protein